MVQLSFFKKQPRSCPPPPRVVTGLHRSWRTVPSLNRDAPQQFQQRALKQFPSSQELQVPPSSLLQTPAGLKARPGKQELTAPTVMPFTATLCNREAQSREIPRKPDGFASKEHLQPCPQQHVAIPALAKASSALPPLGFSSQRESGISRSLCTTPSISPRQRGQQGAMIAL